MHGRIIRGLGLGRGVETAALAAAGTFAIAANVSMAIFALVNGPKGVALLDQLEQTSRVKKLSTQADDLSRTLKNRDSDVGRAVKSNSPPSEEDTLPIFGPGFLSISTGIACGLSSRALVDFINERRLPEKLQKDMTGRQHEEWCHRQEVMTYHATLLGALSGWLAPVGMVIRR